MPFQKTVVTEMVRGQITLDRRVNIFNGRLVSGVHIVGPETVATHSGKHLAGQFDSVIAWNGRE